MHEEEGIQLSLEDIDDKKWRKVELSPNSSEKRCAS